MKNFVLILIGLFIASFSYSQENEGEIVVSKTQDLKEVLSSETQYLFDEFVDGVVYYTSGKGSKGKMNYNLLLNEIHFVSPDEEVLAISDPNTINFVVLSNKIFIYNSRFKFMEVLFNGDVKLLLHRKLIVKEKQDEYKGAYGESSSSANVKYVDRLNLGGGYIDDLSEVNKDVHGEILYQEQFFVQDPRKRVYLVSSLKPFEKIIGKKNKEKVNDFVDTNDINIDNPKDLYDLTQWLNSEIK